MRLGVSFQLPNPKKSKSKSAIMSDPIPQVCTGAVNRTEEQEEERLRIRKNCILCLYVN